ncbi:hypothetical protein AHAS_Ahas20G0269700 [Arachis hypogaea]
MTTHPHMNTHEAIDFLREEFDLVLHPKMVYRAVREAKDRIMGNEIEQYGKLRNYLMTRPAAPVIKRPIGRPKVHNRQKDPAETVIEAPEVEGEEHNSATPTNQNHSTTSTTSDVAQQQPAPQVTSATTTAVPARQGQESQQPSVEAVEGSSDETLAAASTGPKRMLQFIPTPRVNNSKK